MYISYDKLWKLLLDKNMSKTELLSLCGISSRTLSKLSKNQNVNTDTLLSICDVLHCDITDIMEIKRDEDITSLYSAFCMHSAPVSSDEYFDTYEFDYKGKKIILKKTIAKANKNIHIRCEENGTLVWVEPVRVGWGGLYDEHVIMSYPFWRDDAVCIVVISGKDMGFKNLDEGIFISWNREMPKGKHIYLMSETRFKLFEPK